MKLSEAIAALERGEEVEFSRDDEWLTFSENTRFDLIAAKSHKFRIKPKPVDPATVWLNFYPDQVFVHTTKARAEREADIHAFRIAVPFREVVPLTDKELARLFEMRDLYSKKTYASSDAAFLLDLLKKQGVE